LKKKVYSLGILFLFIEILDSQFYQKTFTALCNTNCPKITFRAVLSGSASVGSCYIKKLYWVLF